jgi:hypothetical protein
LATKPTSLFITVALLACNAWASGAAARVFVEPFAEKSGGAALRMELMRQLGKEAGITVASDAASADFLISGMGETYIKGYLSNNPRVRYLNSEARPVYGGYLSVELKNPQQETVWSYLVTPRRFGPEDINQNLAGQMARRLTEEIQAQRKAGHP